MSASAADDVNVGVPVCPRHPDRESYVRCQRCQRPVLPAVPAAGGGRRPVRRLRRRRHRPGAVRPHRLGGRARQGEQPYVTYV